MLVKICGITNAEDAQIVVDAGADLFGMIFVPGTKRYITADRAQAILDDIGERIPAVGVFRDAQIDTLIATVKRLNLPMIQLHGSESPDDADRICDALPDCRILKAFGFENRQSLDAALAWWKGFGHRDRLFAVLLDGPWGGGTGKAFDWAELASLIGKDDYKILREKIFLAGGLNSQNVGEAIKILHPLGVDVSSWVEFRPGVKSADKVRAFVHRAKA